MNKILLMLCVVLVLGFAGAALAGPPEKVEVCHNGSIYVGLPDDPYDEERIRLRSCEHRLGSPKWT